jgi:hypothetical protein
MIQLATEPTASRMSFRPLARGEPNAKEFGLEPRPSRSGHAWPFLSPHAARPVRQESATHTVTDSGS